MEKTRFRTLVAAYGSDLARWPAAERAAADAYVRTADGDDLALLREGASLDTLLAQAPTQTVNAALMARVLASAAKPARRGVMEALFGRRAAVAQAGLAAACLALMSAGTAAGWAAGRGAVELDEADAFITMAYDATFEDLFTAEDLDG